LDKRDVRGIGHHILFDEKPSRKYNGSLKTNREEADE
jgi:hypothetical protein